VRPAGGARLFAYGTLAFADVMEAVAGTAFSSEAAMLDGWARCRVREAVYPGVRAAPGATVDGVLYRDVGPRALARLDRFEGALYERRLLAVRTASGDACEAWTYVVPDALAHRLADEPWDPLRFRQEHLAPYLARCRAGRVARGYAG
jgi:gamma-glutamylcyclotransferase (GGCT)/AIG2-like uncharacterized protein YtfP